MKGKKLLLTTLLATTMAFAFAGCKGGGGDTSSSNSSENSVDTSVETSSDSSTSVVEDTQKPVITVSNVPTTGKVNEEVTLPAATATDDVDGDVSSKIKVKVIRLKENGDEDRTVVNNKAGNVEQKFTPNHNTRLGYKIVYTVKDNAGNEEVVTYPFTAIPDNETGTLTLNSDSVSGFDIATGIVGVAGNEVKLPSATAIDNPSTDAEDISTSIVARLYEKHGDEIARTMFAKWEDFTEVKTVRIPAGEYVLVYSVEDASGNEFEDTYTIPVSIADPEEKNLILDDARIAYDNDEGFDTGKEGMSWINKYDEFCFGHTSALPDLSQTVGFTEQVTKVHEQYVAISFNADPAMKNGQAFYTLSARGSKNSTTMPNKETCTWPNYLFLRMQSTGVIESRVDRNADAKMTEEKPYTGANLIDGKNHVLYVQWKNFGATADATDASIKIYGWVDKTPAVGYEYADFVFRAVAGETTKEGVLERGRFEALWNENTGAGWFSMDTQSPATPHADDHMRVKGLVIYDSDETEFGVDILPPEITTGFVQQDVYSSEATITIPTATVEGADSVKAYIIDGAGVKTEVTNGSFKAPAIGTYTLLYEATDSAGNYAYKEYTLRCMAEDAVPPTLTLDNKETITVNVGDKVTLPYATVTDDITDELDMDVKVEVMGTEYKLCTNGGIYYPMTAGTQTVVYSVSDAYGNKTTDEITINVNSTASGNMLGSTTLLSSGGGQGLADQEYIYDQKVSMILNIAQLAGIVQFNVRGETVNGEWPEGMVIRFVGDNTISVSAFKHDNIIFGNTAYSKQAYIVGTDILFEYQVKNVVIADVEYIRTQIWIQGEELVFTADGSKGGLVGLETGVNALYRKVSDFTDNEVTAKNIYSSPFWFSVYNATAEVKELRIDGTSCTKPADPVPPDRHEINFNTGDKGLITSPATVTGGGDADAVIGKYSNEEYVAVTFNGELADKGAFCLNVTGEASGWNGGIVFRFSQDGAEIHVGGINTAKAKAKLDVYPFDGMVNAKSYTLVYKLTYVDDGTGKKTAVNVDVWFGEAGGTLAKCTMSSIDTDTCTYNNGTLTISALAFPNATMMTPGNITVMSRGALNGTCTWTVSKVEILSGAPNA